MVKFTWCVAFSEAMLKNAFLPEGTSFTARVFAWNIGTRILSLVLAKTFRSESIYCHFWGGETHMRTIALFTLRAFDLKAVRFTTYTSHFNGRQNLRFFHIFLDFPMLSLKNFFHSFLLALALLLFLGTVFLSKFSISTWFLGLFLLFHMPLTLP